MNINSPTDYVALSRRSGYYDKYSQLLKSHPETINQVISASRNQFEKFQTLYSVFKNSEKFADRTAKLIGRDYIDYKENLSENNNFMYYCQYLIHPGIRKEAREKQTHALMSWIQNADGDQLDMLMDILEWDRDETYSIRTFGGENKGDVYVVETSRLKHLFHFSRENFKRIFDFLKNHQGKSHILNTITFIKEKGWETDDSQAIALAIQLDQRGLDSWSMQNLLELHFTKEHLLNLDPEILRKCRLYEIDFHTGRWSDLAKQARTRSEFRLLQSLTSDEWDLITGIPKDNPEAVWENYVVRKADWDKLYSNSSQVNYGSLMHHAVKMASALLRQKGWDSEKILKFHVRQRQIIADLLNHPQKYVTGKKRKGKDDPMTTYCYGYDAYQPLSDRLWKRIQEGQSSHLEITGMTENSAIVQFVEEIDGKPLKLSMVIFKNALVPGTGETDCTQVKHTEPENAGLAMDYVVHSLYPKAMEESEPKKLTALLGEIFWWICQAKPWQVGDPSTAELYIRTLWTSKGLESPPWRKGVIPWEEVMVEPSLKAFSENFHTLFEWKQLLV
jgi:hypothetical protein